MPKPGKVGDALVEPERTIKMWLPLPPLEVNAGHSHWGKRHRAVQDYHTELDLRCPGHHIPRPPAEPFERAHIKVVFHAKSSSHFMDPDNRRARLKRPIDWLRTRGYIKNDRSANITIEDSDAIFNGTEPVLCSLYLELTPK